MVTHSGSPHMAPPPLPAVASRLGGPAAAPRAPQAGSLRVTA